MLLFTDSGTDIQIERTKAPHSAPIATKPIINIAKKFFEPFDRLASMLGSGIDLPRPGVAGSRIESEVLSFPDAARHNDPLQRVDTHLGPCETHP